MIKNYYFVLRKFMIMPNTILYYIWLNNYFCFKNAGFNLSTKYRIEYDEKEHILSGKVNSDYVDDFYTNGIDFTAVVGKNGTGKTTLLKFLMDLDYNIPQNTEYILVYECDGAMYYNTNINKYIESDSEFAIAKSIAKKNKIFARTIYSTEMFNAAQFANQLNGYDWSFAACLRRSSEESANYKLNPVTQYIHNSIKWQIDFFANGRKYIENFKISYPKCVWISLLKHDDAFVDMYAERFPNKATASKDNATNSPARLLLNNFLPDTSTDKQGLFQAKLARAMFTQIVAEANTGANKEQKSNIIELVEEITQSNNNSAWENLRSFLQSAIDNRDHKQKSYNFDGRANLEFMDYINELLRKDNKFNPYLFFGRLSIAVDSEQIDIVDLKTTISELFNNYSKTAHIFDYLSFSWGLSSGETLLLNTFSKITHLLKKNENGNYYLPDDSNSNNKADDLLLLFDEAEVAFHPEWQREYLNAMLHFIEHTIAASGTHVQMIMATHSPIILSDVPKQNTVFLHKEDDVTRAKPNDEQHETFGASIYTLFNDSFFMEEGAIGVVGAQLIRSIIDAIKNGHSQSTGVFFDTDTNLNIEKVKQYISLIGDELIQKQLLQMLLNYLPKSQRLEELKRQQANIAKTIARLEKGDEQS